ncbi:hypothetical protein ACLBWS_06675 [Brucellaceae bacterium D45D]
MQKILLSIISVVALLAVYMNNFFDLGNNLKGFYNYINHRLDEFNSSSRMVESSLQELIILLGNDGSTAAVFPNVVRCHVFETIASNSYFPENNNDYRGGVFSYKDSRMAVVTEYAFKNDLAQNKDYILLEPGKEIVLSFKPFGKPFEHTKMPVENLEGQKSSCSIWGHNRVRPSQRVEISMDMFQILAFSENAIY